MKKTLHALFIVLTLLVLLVSCNEDKRQTVTLTLVLNNGSDNEVYKKEIGEIMLLPTPQRNGIGVTVESGSTNRDFVFLCWVDENGNEYRPESNYSFTSENVTLQAVWQLNVCVENLYGNRTVIDARTNGSYEVPSSALVDPSHSYIADASGNARPMSSAVVNDDIMLVEHRYEYRVSFNANGGSGSMEDQICLSGITSPMKDCTFTAPSAFHTFAGWNTKADGSGTFYTESSSLTGNIVLYAQWKGPAVVTFDPNGGSGTMESQAFAEGEPQALTANAFAAEKKLFSSWNTKADGSGTSYEDKAVATFSANTTLYAQWLELYSVSFNTNGGEGSMEGQTFIEGQAQELKANAFSYSNMAFTGWNTSADGTGSSYADRASTTFSCDTVLYAQWEPASCYVTFNSNGGSGTMNSQAFTSGKPQALTANAFTAEKKAFERWDTQMDGNGTSYEDKAVATITSDLVLYAQWLDTYEISFNGNGVAGSMEVQTFIEGQSQNLVANSFAAEKKIFTGWNTKADGSGVAYEDKSSAAFTEDTTLYAQWLNEYDVTFDANGGSGSMEVQTFIEGQSQNLAANAFTAEKKIFTGWNTKADGSGTAYEDNASASFTENTVLYAQWLNIYVVTFSSNGGTGTMERQSFIEGESLNLTTNAFTAEKKQFTGWNTKADGSGTAYEDNASVSFTQDTVLYAQWVDILVITFDGNGVSGSMEPQIYMKGIRQNLKPNTFAPGDRIFTGWNTSPTGSGIFYEDELECVFLSDTVLYAQWEFNITFNANGGSGSMDIQIFGSDEMKLLKANEFVFSGKSFNGWNTKADGSGTSYGNKALVKFTSNTTLYAQWLNNYSITFMANGGTGTMESQVFIEGKSQELSANEFTAPSMKIFVGWNTSVDGSGTMYADGDILTLTSDITLYAQWEDLVYDFEIGGTGPAGGIVFYNCDADNASGNADGLISSECGWCYLEAAAEDLQAGKTFIFGYHMTGDSAVFVNGSSYVAGTSDPDDGKSTGTAIGTGKANTVKLENAMGTAAYSSNWKTDTSADYAARLASEYTAGGYDDWFLPSKDELDLMYVNLKSKGLGGFSSDYYWSSSECSDNANSAWNQVFNGGSQFCNLRNITRKVRCIRAF